MCMPYYITKLSIYNDLPCYIFHAVIRISSNFSCLFFFFKSHHGQWMKWICFTFASHWSEVMTGYSKILWGDLPIQCYNCLALKKCIRKHSIKHFFLPPCLVSSQDLILMLVPFLDLILAPHTVFEAFEINIYIRIKASRI